MTIRIAVAGVSGYSGLELLKIALRHPAIECAALMASDSTGEKPISEIHPQLRSLCDHTCVPWNLHRLRDLHVDTVFLCTPNETSHELVPGLLAAGYRIIDLSGSFRLQDETEYDSWYGFRHGAPDLLPTACYGLAEWKGRAIASARLIANPGCYATSALLALLPLVSAGLIQPGSEIICDAKSGVTGAGRSAKTELLFGEVAGSFRPYSPIAHRHVPEICQELDWHLDHFTFVPHLLPVQRGILSTIYVRFSRTLCTEEIEEEYRRRYQGSRFIRVLGSTHLPELRAVNYTNFCDIAWRVTDMGKRAVLFSAIDNLIKGAAGQAIQNFNLMHGLDEGLGLL
jgi:N-acetyl-gamma-glutamyl-phosphate reductase